MKQTYKVAIGDVKFSKKTTISIEIKGNLSDAQKLDLLEFAQSDGFMQLSSAQRDIEDYEVPKTRSVTGLSYSVNGGEVKVDSEQLEIDDVIGDDIAPEETVEAVNEEMKELNWLEQEELIAEQAAWEKPNPDANPEPQGDPSELIGMGTEDEEEPWEEESAEDELSDELE